MAKADTIEGRLVKESKLKEGITPNYTGLGLANIMPTISGALGSEQKNQYTLSRDVLDYDLLKGVKKVVFFMIDGLGYHQLLKEMKSKSAFKELSRDLVPLTSVLPSTTATALTTISSGLTPQEHGIMEYKLYLKELGMLTNVMTFGPAMGGGSFEELGLDPIDFFKIKTLYQEWKRRGIKSHILLNVEYISSSFSQFLYQGAEIIPCTTLGDIFSETKKLLSKNPNKKEFIYLYWDKIDSVSHQQGANSKKYSKELEHIDYELGKFIDKAKGDFLFIITSDHGQINSDSKKMVYYQDHGKLIDSLIMPPVGEMGRLNYLYVKRSKRDFVKNYVKGKLADKAVMIETEKAIRDGFFGINKPRKETFDRTGDFVLLPKNGYTFSYPYTIADLFMRFVGVHGGISKEEMLVPFICKSF